MSAKTKAVIFDCGGVLAEDCPVLCFVHLATRYPAEEQARIKDLHKRNYDCWNKYKLDKTYTEDNYWNDIISRENLNEDVNQMKAFLRESLQCYTEVIEVARKIKESGFTVGIMSNHSVEWFDSISSKFNLGSIFPQQTTIVSQAVGAAKPDAAIMDILMSALSKEIPSLQREEVVFIDDKKNNVDAAIEFGLRAIVFDASKEKTDALLARLKDNGVLF